MSRSHYRPLHHPLHRNLIPLLPHPLPLHLPLLLLPPHRRPLFLVHNPRPLFNPRTPRRHYFGYKMLNARTDALRIAGNFHNVARAEGVIGVGDEVGLIGEKMLGVGCQHDIWIGV